jgi:hypothetical protein
VGNAKVTSLYYENGDEYSGDICNGLRDGEGTLIDSMTGMTYEGEWKNDEVSWNILIAVRWKWGAKICWWLIWIFGGMARR